MDVSRRQEDRDARAFAEERIDDAIDAVGTLAIELAYVVASGLELHMRFTDFVEAKGVTREYIQSHLDDKVEGDLLLSVQAFRDKLTALRSALTNLQMNTLARRCYMRELSPAKSAMTRFGDESTRRKFLRGELFVHNDLAGASQFLDIAIRRLADARLGHLFEAQLSLSVIDSRHELSASLQSLIFTGNLIFALTEPTLDLHMAVGTGMLHDIYRSLPDGATIRTVMRDSYPEGGVTTAVQRTIIDFVPAGVVGPNVSTTFDALSPQLEILIVDFAESA